MVKNYQSSVGEIETSRKKSLTLVGAISFVVGNMVGSGIFVNVASSASATPKSPGILLFIWLLGGIVALVGAVCYAELSLYFGKSGGETTFLGEVLGKPFGITYIYSYNVLVASPSIAFGALTFAKYLLIAIDKDRVWDINIERSLALSLLFYIMLLNLVSVTIPQKIQIVFTIAKSIGLGVIIIVGFVYLGKGGTRHFKNPFDTTGFNPITLTFAIASSFWSFEGWNTLGHIAGESKNPKKDIPLAFVIGLLIVTSLYLLTISGYISVMGMAALIQSKTIAANLGFIAFGQYGWIMSIFIVLSTIGFVNGYFFATCRITLVAAFEGELPSMFTLVHSKTRSPIIALLALQLTSAIFLFVDFDALIAYSSFVSWLFYFIAMVVLFYIRFKRKDLHSGFKVPLIFPIILQIAAVYIIFMTFWDTPLECAIILGYIIIVLGIHFVPTKILNFSMARDISGMITYGLKIGLDLEPAVLADIGNE